MKRVVTVCLAAAAALSGAPALAALSSSLETERRWYRPGETAEVRGTSPPGSRPAASLHAFLVESSATAAARDVPRAHLGVLRIAGSPAAGWELSIRFVVPDLPPGRYVVDVCARPCRVDGAGASASPGLWIGGSKAEARLAHRARVATRRADRLERRLEEKVDDPGDRVRAPARPAAVGRSTGLLPLLAGTAVGVLLGLLVRRRPRVIALVPYDPLSPPARRGSSRRRLR